jgi:hypothetical protein
VLESTRNIDGFVDPFTEERDYGVNIFKLYERLHQFHGVSVSTARHIYMYLTYFRYGGALYALLSMSVCICKLSSGCGVSTN